MKRPDYWSNWTKHIPLALLLLISAGTFPFFVFVHGAAGFAVGVRAWWREFRDILEEIKGARNE